MNAENARQLFPKWAATPLPEEQEEERRLPWRMKVDELAHKWKKKYGILIVGAILFTAWTVGTCCITGSIVRHNTTLEVQSEMRQNFTEYLAQLERERQAAALLTGDASLQTAINKDAILLARIGQGVINTYKAADVEDARKVMLCAVCRVHSGGEFAGIKSIADAVKQPGQWWGYEDGLSYTEAVHSAAMEISSIYHRGEAMPCSTDMVYAGWNGSEIVLRNQWEANSHARYF